MYLLRESRRTTGPSIQQGNFDAGRTEQADFSTTEITLLDLCLHKGERFAKEGILDIKTHIKPTNT